MRSFTVEYLNGDTWVQAATGTTIGVSRIVKLATPVTAQQWRITVTSARGQYAIADWSLLAFSGLMLLSLIALARILRGR